MFNPFDYREEYEELEREAYEAMEAEAYAHMERMSYTDQELYQETLAAEFHREMMEDVFGPLDERY